MPSIGANITTNTRAALGSGLRLGANLVTNGTFGDATGWTLGTGWTISGGTLSSDGTGVAGENALFSAGAANSTQYRLRFEISNYVSGTLDVIVGDQNLADGTANGVYQVDFTSGVAQNGVLFLQTYAFIGDIDNVTLREIL